MRFSRPYGVLFFRLVRGVDNTPKAANCNKPREFCSQAVSRAICAATAVLTANGRSTDEQVFRLEPACI